MEDRNYQDAIERLQEMKLRCGQQGEASLEYYCENLLRIRRAYYKTEKAEMLSYVRNSMDSVLPLVIEYFLDRAETYLYSKDLRERTDILLDIERSVLEFNAVFDAMVYSTNSADRMLFQTVPMDSAMRYIPPKLCVYYASLLRAYAELMSGGGTDKYAFCVYPSLNLTAEASVLFSTMPKSGKVGIIRVPVNTIADVERVRVSLFHELFHILPADLRKRRARAPYFLRILLHDLTARLLKGCKWDGVPCTEEELRAFFFGSVIKRAGEVLGEKGDTDRIFYSSQIKEVYLELLQKRLYEIQENGQEEFQRWILKTKGKLLQNYAEYDAAVRGIRAAFVQIRSNIFILTSRYHVQRLCNIYMGLFREIFADVYTIIMLHLSEESYFQTLDFLHSTDPQQELNSRFSLCIRAAFVTNILSGGVLANMRENLDGDEELLARWRVKDKKEPEGQEGAFKQAVFELKKQIFQGGTKKQSNSLVGKAYDVLEIVLNTKMIECYQEYFENCCRELLLFRKCHENEFEELERRFYIGDRFGRNDENGFGKEDISVHIAGCGWMFGTEPEENLAANSAIVKNT